MFYRSHHVEGAQRLRSLLDTLAHDADELRRMLSIYDDAMEMPGRRPDNDPERTGRQATHGPSRPTEAIALDDARAAMQEQVNNGVRFVAHAVACVRGTTAAMDRALSRWEGESSGVTGSGNESADGAAGIA